MRVHLIGDVHLGKKFENGVPLHRRGHREKMQFEQFLVNLDVPCDLNIQMGDIFDKMYVPYNVIWAAAQAYIERAGNGTTYVVMRGNHDASRDADKVSAFDIFAGLVRPHGIIVADEEAVQVGTHVIIPWHPFKTAIEMLPQKMDGLAAYGHWDIVMGDTNQIPAAEMKARGVIEAYTGHDHNYRHLKIEGLPVTVTGSMQPYSHAEDPDGALYVTLGLKDLDQDLTNKCVRLVLQPGEDLLEPIDCLQLQIQRLTEETEMEQVEFETFDLLALFNEAVRSVELSEELIPIALSKMEEARATRA